MWQGTVLLNGHPVCDTNWDDEDAYVICRKLQFPQNVRAFAHKGGKFGIVNRKFLVGDVSCRTGATTLSACSMVTAPTCDQQQQAGVTCLDPKHLFYDDDFDTPKLASFYFCANQWTEVESSILCKTAKGKAFSMRNGVVPVKETTSFPMKYDSYITGTKCNGQESSITECEMDIRNSCDRVISVKCAKCEPEYLLGLVKQVAAKTDMDAAKIAIGEARKSLLGSCYDWSCDGSQSTHNSYEEYCVVKAFLNDAEMMLTEPITRPILDVETDYKKQLEHLFIKSELNGLKNMLTNISRNIGGFQRNLGQYFHTIAEFNRAKAISDYNVVKDSWMTYEAELELQGGRISSKIREIINAALGSASAQLVDDCINVAMAAISFAKNPMEPGNIADAVIQMQEQMGKLASTTNDLVQIKLFASGASAASATSRAASMSTWWRCCSSRASCNLPKSPTSHIMRGNAPFQSSQWRLMMWAPAAGGVKMNCQGLGVSLTLPLSVAHVSSGPRTSP